MPTVYAPHDCYLPVADADLKAGDPVEVPAEVAANLVEQGWPTSSPKAAKSDTSPPKSAPVAPPPADTKEP